MFFRFFLGKIYSIANLYRSYIYIQIIFRLFGRCNLQKFYAQCKSTSRCFIFFAIFVY